MTKLDFLKNGLAVLTLPPGLRSVGIADRAARASLILDAIWAYTFGSEYSPGTPFEPEFILMAAVHAGLKDVSFGRPVTAETLSDIAREAVDEARARLAAYNTAAGLSNKVPY